MTKQVLRCAQDDKEQILRSAPDDKAMTEFTLFDTAIGTCGIAWTSIGIRAVQLPEGSSATTRARLLHRNAGAVPGSPPNEIQATVDSIMALLSGEAIDLTAVPLDDA